MTNETGQVIYETSTPFRLGMRTTTLYKVMPNEDPEDMLASFEANVHGTRWSVVQMGHRFLDSPGKYACVFDSPNI